MANDVEIIGADKIIEKMKDIADPEKYKRALEKCCLLVERSAIEKAKKGKTGDLKRSIASRVEEDGGDLIGVVYTNLEYAPYVEFGTGLFAEEGGRLDVPWNYQDEKGEWHSTSGMKPQPFLRPALNENREEILRRLKEGSE